MKKIKITEAQAGMLSSLPHKKVVKINQRQLNAIRENLGDDITSTFKKEFSGHKPPMKFEGTLNESPTVEILEILRGVIEFILSELGNESSAGLDPIFADKGISRGEIFRLLSDAGLIGMVFYQLSYNEKINKIKSVINPIISGITKLVAKAAWRKTFGRVKSDEMGGTHGVASETDAGSSGAYVSGMSNSGPHKDTNDDFIPSAQLGNDIEVDTMLDTLLTDAESTFQELLGLAIGTERKIFSVAGVEDKRVDEKGKVSYLVTLDDAGELSNSHLLFTYDPMVDKAYIQFNHDFNKLIAAEKVIPEEYHDNLNTIGKCLAKEAKRTDETSAGHVGGSFDANPFSDDGDFNINATNDLTSREGSKPPNMRHESVDNMKDTAYPDGGFVEFDDCVRPGNKEAINGGCSQGAVDNVVKVKKSKNSVVSNQKG